jgi:TatA/E family protein of Tat protein translocase
MFSFLKNISTTEIVILVIILVLLFGAKTIVGLGKTSGETVRELKKVKKEFDEAIGLREKDPSKS